MYMFNQIELKNLLVCLQNVQITGEQAKTIVALQEKIEFLLKPPLPKTISKTTSTKDIVENEKD
jgi:hypothetical protein